MVEHKSSSFWSRLSGLLVTIVTFVVMVLLGILYFMLTMWVIKLGAVWAGYPNVEGDMVLLTAGIVTAATIVGSALQK